MFSSFAEMAPCGHPSAFYTNGGGPIRHCVKNWFEVAIAADYRRLPESSPVATEATPAATAQLRQAQT
jgi:hypothetical protein